MLTVSYILEDGKVYFLSSIKKKKKAVKTDAASFESLEFGYARDKNHIFSDGKRLQVNDRASFDPIAKGFAIDKNYVYVGSSRIRLDKGQDISQAKIIAGPESQNLLALILDRTAYCLWNDRLSWVAEDIDPESLQILHSRYCCDAKTIRSGGNAIAENSKQLLMIKNDCLIVGKDVFNGPLHISSEGDSFVALDSHFVDCRHVYNHAGKVLADIKAPRIEDISLQHVQSAFLSIASLVFHLYDHNYSMQKSVCAADRPIRRDGMPSVKITFEGAETILTFKDRTFRGRASAFPLLLSRAWSWHRRYTVHGEPTVVFCNYLGSYELDFDAFWDKVVQTLPRDFVTLIIWFYQQDQIEESSFLLEALLRPFHCALENVLSIIPNEILQKVETPSQKYKDVFPFRSTYLANGKLAVDIQKSEPDPAKRYFMAWHLCQIVSGTGKLPFFTKAVFESLTKLIPNENNDAIKQWLLLAVEIGCALNHQNVDLRSKDPLQAYAAVRYLAGFLIEQRVNTATNHARLWEAAHFSRDTAQIEASKQALSDVVALDCRALSTLSTGQFTVHYPNFQFMLVILSLRIAALTTREIAEKILSRAITEAEKVRQIYNVHSLGNVLCEFQQRYITAAKIHHLPLPFNDRTIRDGLSGYADTVATLRQSDYTVSRCELVGQGLYTINSPLKFLDLELVDQGPSLKVSVGDYIGLDYFLDGQPWNRHIPTQITIDHPPRGESAETQTEFPQAPSYLGMKNSFYWHFDCEDEILKGKWTFTIQFPGENVRGLKNLKVEFDIKVKE